MSQAYLQDDEVNSFLSLSEQEAIGHKIKGEYGWDDREVEGEVIKVVQPSHPDGQVLYVIDDGNEEVPLGHREITEIVEKSKEPVDEVEIENTPEKKNEDKITIVSGSEKIIVPESEAEKLQEKLQVIL